ncbi:MAG: replication initiator protein [Microviridae sp.]|nr:MAG: replication initiator protein [Microviridae sp.]
MCLYPTLIKNKKYTANKKNGGQVPPVYDNRVMYVPIGCGGCIECRKKKSREWKVRLLEEIKREKNGVFITLTFSEESMKDLSEKVQENGKLEGYNLDNAVATQAVRYFLERWRKKYKKSVRHWLVTELGHNGTERIHMHGIIWTDNWKV